MILPMKKSILWIVVLIIIGAIALFTTGGNAPEGVLKGVEEGAELVQAGSYKIDTEESTLMWSGRKPLVENYVEAGTLDLAPSTITVGAEGAVSGTLNLDMTSITVTEIVVPGQEGALEKHLKMRIGGG